MKFFKLGRRWPFSMLVRDPFTCNIKVTQRCNLRCYFCGLHKLSGKPELTVDQYRKVADVLHRAGLARVVLTGGEPFIRPDLPEIVAILGAKSFSTTLLTNGTMASYDQLRQLYELGLDDVGVSLDTLKPELQASICGGIDIWDRAVTTIRNAVSIFDKGIVEVLITVTPQNIHEITDLVEFVHHDLKAYAVVNPVNVTPDQEAILTSSPGSNPPLIDPATVDRVYDRLLQMKKSKYRIFVSDKFLEASREYLKTGHSGWSCDAGELYFTIFSDGSLSPCSDRPAIANILHMSPSSFKDPEFRRQAMDSRRVCPGCIFSCWREASYLFRYAPVMKERFKLAFKLMLPKGLRPK